MWLNFRSSLVVFVLFWLSNMGDFSLWYSLAMGMNIIFGKYNPKKIIDIRVGSDWLIFCWLNFERCQLWCQLNANFLNFPKHPQLLTFGWIWRKLWPKIRKKRNKKICQFEPTLKSYLFSGWNFLVFFSSPIFDSQKSTKTTRKLLKMSHI